MSAFPPYRTSNSIPVDQSTALKYLSAYLISAETTPYFLPNARLEPSGPTSGSANSSVTIHNLKRVEAGLRGEWLAPTIDLEESVPVAQDEVAEVDDGAMDLGDYQREQSIDGGEIGEDETHVINQEGDSDMEDTTRVKKEIEHEEDESMDAKEEDEDRPAPMAPPNPKKMKPKSEKDKAARKAEKKARRKAEKVTVMNSKHQT